MRGREKERERERFSLRCLCKICLLYWLVFRWKQPISFKSGIVIDTTKLYS